MDSHFFPAFVILLFVFNPLECLYKLRSGISQTAAGSNHKIIAKTCIWFLCILLVTIWLGQTLMDRLSVSLASVQVSSGLLLFLLAVHMIFSAHAPSPGDDTQHGMNAFIAKLAYTTGPIALANVLLLSASQTGHTLALATAVSCALFACVLLIRLCYRLQGNFGFVMAANGAQKLMGLLLTAIAVDKILIGCHHYFSA
ncbi:MarC family protein [Undibacterium sp. Ren11W]|uniref:MarC family protein n=1 Tax=Undibacterium sp. Ren11W TaxID=3413045 RepID=UPI003BF0FE4D